MKNITLLLIVNILFASTALGQVNQDGLKDILKNQKADKSISKNNIWKTLSKITFKKQYDEMMGFKVDIPVFSEEVKALDGKEVTIKGYIIPVEGYKSHKEFVFSAYPYNMCFFCGGAGPETVMEVSALEGIKFQADPVTIKGILQTNSGDINRLIYSMTKATLVKK